MENIVNRLNSEIILFNPQNTAINTHHSKSADMLISEIEENDNVLDYGLGIGRNVRHIHNSTGLKVHGCDIVEQLQKEQKAHDQLRKQGHKIETSNNLKDNYYNKVLCSHVLNVIQQEEREFVMADIYNKMSKGGIVYLEVRTKQDIEKAKTKEVYGNGYMVKSRGGYNYQEGISKECMQDLFTRTGFTIIDHKFNSSTHIVKAIKQ